MFLNVDLFHSWKDGSWEWLKWLFILFQVSLAALKSLQEMLQAGRSSTPSSSSLPEDSNSPSYLNSPVVPEDSIANWNTAWKVVKTC